MPNKGDVVSSPTLNQRAIERLRAEMSRRDLSQRDVAGIAQWTQSKVAQKVTGRTPLTLDELEALSFAVSLSPVELVRDHGLQFCAEMTPTELRILERIRQLAPAEREALMLILRVNTTTKREERGARRAIPKRRLS